MKNFKTLLLLSVVATASIGQAIDASNELARVNSRVITLEEFNRRYHDSARYFQTHTPTRKLVLQEVINRELAIQEARRRGLDRDPEVREQLDTVLFQAQVNKALSHDVEQIHVSDEEAQRYYERNPEIRTSQIFVGVPPDATAEQDRAARQRIEQIYNQLVKPAKMGFAEVAQKYSEAPNAAMGGDVGYLGRGQLDPAVYQAAIHLQRGQTSAVVRSQFGYHIIKLTAKHAWEEADHAQIKHLVSDERREQLYQKYMTQLRAQAHISVRSELL